MRPADSLQLPGFLLGNIDRSFTFRRSNNRGPTMALIDQINEGIKEAIRSRDSIRLATLRMLKSKILAVDARASLPDGEVLKLFKTYYGSLQEALEQAEAARRPDIAEPLKSELKIVQEFLPQTPSPEATRALVIQAIAESGAKTKKDVGLVMKTVMKLNSALDGKELAAELLPDS
jgi:uncharacterized protein